MNVNKCISPSNLKGRPIRDMERRGILGECDKNGYSREERKAKQIESQRKRLRSIEKMRRKQELEKIKNDITTTTTITTIIDTHSSSHSITFNVPILVLLVIVLKSM